MKIENVDQLALSEQHKMIEFIQNNLEGRHPDVQQDLLDQYTRNRNFKIVIQDGSFKVML